MRRIAVLALAFGAVITRSAGAQSEPQLVGPVRDIARAELVYPATIDPLLVLPMTPEPQAVIEAQNGNVTGAVRGGVQNGDTNYSFTVSGPLSQSSATRFLDRLTIPHPTFGFDLTNVMWRPKAKPAFTQQLGTMGFLTAPAGQALGPSAPGTAPAALSRESAQAVARAINTTDAVDLPCAVIVSAGYKFSSQHYGYVDPVTSTGHSDSHLSDLAHALVGVQFLSRTNDPGYFVAFSFNYSSLFFDRDLKVGPPTRLFGTILRLDMRRPFVTPYLGVSSSLSYEMDTRVKTLEATTYWWFSNADRSHIRNATKLNVGIRVGYQDGRGGFFAGVFLGPVFGSKL